MSSEEIRKQHIQKMGEQKGSLFFSLHNDFINLLVKWKEYQELFMQGENRIQVLNDTAPSFFYRLQRMMIDDMVMNIIRMIESVNSGNRKSKNATLLHLIHLVEDEQFKKTLLIKYSLVRKNVKQVEIWRNKKIAHRDIELHTLSEKVSQSIGLSPKDIRGTINSVKDVFLSIYLNYFDAQFMYDYIEPQKSAISLLHYLDLGKRAEFERIKVMKSGDRSDMDFAHIRNRSFE